MLSIEAAYCKSDTMKKNIVSVMGCGCDTQISTLPAIHPPQPAITPGGVMADSACGEVGTAPRPCARAGRLCHVWAWGGQLVRGLSPG